jgi:hypothetical protein
MTVVAHPLYDKLVKNINDSQIKNIDVGRVCSTINNFWKDLPKDQASFHYEWIASLILHHYILSNKGNITSSTCYNCKLMPGDSGELYTISNLPIDLQQIIAEYLVYYNS